MPDHYYTQRPESPHRAGCVEFAYRGRELRFSTDSGVFSRLELDRGTEELLRALPDELSGRVLDMGCGYGAIGVAVGKAFPGTVVTMADINERAAALSCINAQRNGVSAEVVKSDGFEGLAGREFDVILTNPPIRAGKAVVYGMFERAARALGDSGSLYAVIRRRQGAESALARLKELFGAAEAITKKGGYWVLLARGKTARKEV